VEEGVEEGERGEGGGAVPLLESYIRLLAFVRLLFHQPHRQTEGFVEYLSWFVDGLKALDYSTMDRRVSRLRIDLDDSLVRSNSPVSIAVDHSGVKVHNGGSGR
jgi:hypothetical protein